MKKININRDWHVYELEESADPFSPPPTPIKTNLPYDAMQRRARIADMPGGAMSGYYPNRNMKFEKHVSLLPGKIPHTIIEFEGVYSNAFVYINGNFCGKCHYGYNNFYLDITPYLIAGEDNVISVETRSGMGQTSRWYTGDGIFRDVNWHEGGEDFLLPGILRVRTVSIPCGDDKQAVIEISGIAAGETDECTISAMLYGEDGQGIATANQKINPDGTFRLQMAVSKPSLWNADSPYLYRLDVKLNRSGVAVDEEMVEFGIRTVEAISGKGLLINGIPVKLKGGCIHHDNGILGAAEYEDAALRRIRIMKEAGFNAVRMAHNPCSKALLSACDKLGMYVMEESFDTWNVSKSPYDYSMFFDECWQYDFDMLVKKDYNHPSVIMYAIGNEIKELNTKQGVEMNRKLVHYLKTLDNTRPILNAINGMFTAMEHFDEIMRDINRADNRPSQSTHKAESVAMEINHSMTMLDEHMDEIMRHEYVSRMLDPICSELDISGYNYMGGRYEMDAAKHPERLIVGSETRPDSISENWERVMRLPNIIGDFVWTGWDYIGEAGIGRVDYENVNGPMYGGYPWLLASAGDIDICGHRRVQSYYREIVWNHRQKPYIAVWNPAHYGVPAHTSNWSWSDAVHIWNWKGFEGKPVHVDVYSNADEVELFLGGESVGKRAVADYKAEFELTYKPMALRAVAYRGGEAAEDDILFPAKDERRIFVSKSRDSLKSGSNELMYLDIKAADIDGVVNPLEEVKIKLEINGPAELVGFGSADPKSTESFAAFERTTYMGRLLAAFRPTAKRGEVRVTCSAEGLESVEASWMAE